MLREKVRSTRKWRVYIMEQIWPELTANENHYFLLVYFIVRRKKPKKIIRVSRVKRADRKLGGVARVAKWAF